MARNPVQFQEGISLNEFLSLYGTEEQCFDTLYQWRWPNGFVCPNCGLGRSCQLTTHKLQQCLRGTYHAIRPKYAQRYLAEFEYRFNRRFDLPESIPRLLYVALRTPPMPERLLKLNLA